MQPATTSSDILGWRPLKNSSTKLKTGTPQPPQLRPKNQGHNDKFRGPQKSYLKRYFLTASVIESNRLLEGHLLRPHVVDCYRCYWALRVIPIVWTQFLSYL